MANTIFKLRRSSVAGKKPTTTDISIGELAINLTDRKLYSSDGSNTWEIGANLTTLAVSTNTTVNNVIISGGVYANGSFGAPGQVLASNSSGLYWTSAADGALPIRQQYTANGSTTSFAVPGGYVSNNISVFLNGVLLRNGTEVDVTSGTNFVITPAPANGSLIDVVGSSAITTLGFNTSVSQQFTANGTANTFSVTNGYIPNQIQVYLNGVKQVPGVDVDVSSGNNVAFTITPSNGFIVDVYGYQTAVVATSNVLTVGANVTLNTSTISIGNSTVNTQITAGNIALNGSLLTIGNSTVNTSLDGGTLVLGTNTATFGAAAYFVANGNVGIGNTAPANKLSVNGTSFLSGQVLINTSNNLYGEMLTSNGAITWRGHTDGINGILNAYDGYAWIGSVTNHPLNIITNNTPRIVVASDGNVGIGTSSPAFGLTLNNSSNYFGVRLQVGGSTQGQIIPEATGNIYIDAGTTSTGGSLVFRTNNGTERARIDSSGNFIVGKTTTDIASSNGISLSSGACQHSFQITSNEAWIYNNRTSGTTYSLSFRTLNVQRGAINVTDSGTTYATSSDYRLKHDIKPITSALATVTALNPVTYKWNINDNHDEVFLAHELQQYVPHAVSGKKDDVNEDGTIKPQGVDYSKLVPILTAAIQELSAKLDEANERIRALESR